MSFRTYGVVHLAIKDFVSKDLDETKTKIACQKELVTSKVMSSFCKASVDCKKCLKKIKEPRP